MSTTLYPGTPVPTTRSWPRRWLADLALAWAAWRAGRRQRLAGMALRELGESTLKDIGLADLVAERRRSVAAENFLRRL